MGLFSFSVGLTVRRGDRTFKFLRELDDHEVLFEDQVTLRPWTVSKVDLWKDLNSGQASIITRSGGSEKRKDSDSREHPESLASLKETDRAEVERRLGYISALRQRGIRKGMRRRIASAVNSIAEKLEDSKTPSASAVMQWWRDFESSGSIPVALAPKHACRKRVRRLPEILVKICRDALKDYYCTTQRPTLVQTQTYIQRQLRAAAGEGGLAPGESNVHISTLRRLKQEIDPYIVDRLRFGAAFATHKWRYSKSGPIVTRALQRYEVDHTVLDIVCVCDRTGMPLGRPTLTLVIDAYSGYIVGFFLSFWGTGLAASFCALKVAIEPKTDLRASIPGLQNPWLSVGLPELLAVDNGLEFHSPQFRAMAAELMIELHYCAVRQPWRKPYVERSLGIINGYLPAAGRVRKPLANDLPEDPSSTAAITFSDLCTGLLKIVCDVHACSINQRTLARPIDLFQESVALLPPPLLPHTTRFAEIIVAPRAELTVGREGVVTKYLRFDSEELQRLTRMRALKFKTEVRFNPETLEYVWVQDPVTKTWLMVPSCQPEYTNGLSMVQHKAIRALKKKELARKGALETLIRGRQELMELWNGSALRGKRIKGDQLRALAGFTSSLSLQGDADRPQRVAAVPITAQEMSSQAEVVPDFETHSLS